ncbi:hypothetical protein ACGFW5_05395 [Streptomyces sp. NPDC048416]|uniref:hypothetical protein n=1 Tax=Streptomyces sp. NPDC048416 TaxID=3365546 RepID=UPI00371A7A47
MPASTRTPTRPPTSTPTRSLIRTRSRTRTLTIAVVSSAVALAFAAVVAVPAVTDWYHNRHEEAASYSSGKEAKADRASVPRWLPDDAKRVEYAMRTTGGDRILKAVLPAASPPASCEPREPDAGPRPPAITASWFPSDAGQRAAVRCGPYYAYMEGHTLYAWQANADWMAENRG